MSDDVRRLAPDTDSLARRIPYGTPAGTLCVLGPEGGVQVVPGATHEVTFGRAAADVDVPLGVEDPAVSRTHGRLPRRRNVGSARHERAIGGKPPSTHSHRRGQ